MTPDGAEAPRQMHRCVKQEHVHSQGAHPGSPAMTVRAEFDGRTLTSATPGRAGSHQPTPGGGAIIKEVGDRT
jgi:hypothetical protein